MKISVDVKIYDIKKTDYFIPECFEHALTMYEYSDNIPVYATYLAEWNFELTQGTTMGEILGANNTLFNNLLHYSGLHIRHIEVKHYEEILMEVKHNLLSGSPTIVHLDTYYCKWGRFYGTIHSEHVVIVIGIDFDKHKLLIVDADYSNIPFYIEFSLLEKASKFYFDIEIVGKYKYSSKQLFEIVLNRKNEYQKVFFNIKQFADLFKNKFNPNIEFKDLHDINCVLDSELILKIRNIIKGRNMFIVFLDKLINDYPHCVQVAEYLMVSMGKWNTIMNLMFKAAQTCWRKGFNEKISNIIMSIASIEEQAFHLFAEGTLNRGTMNSKLHNDMYYCETICISGFCNNKGFAFNERSANVDLTSAGEYFKLDEAFKEVYFEGLRFKTCFESDMDNIVCKGQEISFDKKMKIKGIAFLACAEWGTCEDAIQVNFFDGRYENYKVIIYDVSEINYDNTIELGCTILHSGEKINQRAGVTVEDINFIESQDVQSIVLPNNPNMHILSITIYKI